MVGSQEEGQMLGSQEEGQMLETQQEGEMVNFQQGGQKIQPLFGTLCEYCGEFDVVLFRSWSWPYKMGRVSVCPSVNILSFFYLLHYYWADCFETSHCDTKHWSAQSFYSWFFDSRLRDPKMRSTFKILNCNSPRDDFAPQINGEVGHVLTLKWNKHGVDDALNYENHCHKLLSPYELIVVIILRLTNVAITLLRRIRKFNVK